MPKQQIIYFWPNLSLLLLNNISTSMHSHYALEIYIALQDPFKMNFGEGYNEYQGVIINSNVPHKFCTTNGPCALILINPNHFLAEALVTNLLDKEPFKKITPPTSTRIINSLSNFHKKKFLPAYARQNIEDLLKEMMKDMPKRKVIDSRIINAISFIRESYKGKIRLSKMATLTSLSASRLRHIFKEETGSTIRQFILNQRIIEAVKLIVDGSTKTNAAYEVGFSDAAHLSRTFKHAYGLALSELYNIKDENTLYFSKDKIE